MNFNTFIAAMLALSAQPAASAQQPASDATVARFLAVIPPASRSIGDFTPEAADLERFNGLNPGRAADVRSALEQQERCLQPVVVAGTERMLANMGRELGEERLTRLIAFYEGPDSALFDRLSERAAGPEGLSDAERRELDRVMAQYPLTEFMAAMERSPDRISQDRILMSGLRRCADAFNAELRRRGLRAQ